MNVFQKLKHPIFYTPAAYVAACALSGHPERALVVGGLCALCGAAALALWMWLRPLPKISLTLSRGILRTTGIFSAAASILCLICAAAGLAVRSSLLLWLINLCGCIALAAALAELIVPAGSICLSLCIRTLKKKGVNGDPEAIAAAGLVSELLIRTHTFLQGSLLPPRCFYCGELKDISLRAFPAHLSLFETLALCSGDENDPCKPAMEELCQEVSSCADDMGRDIKKFLSSRRESQKGAAIWDCHAPDGENILICRGEPALLAGMCAGVLYKDKPAVLDDDERDRIEEAVRKTETRGCKPIAVAVKRGTNEKWLFAGFAGFGVLREQNLKKVTARLAKAGVGVRIIGTESAAALSSLAEAAGINGKNTCIGEQLAGLTGYELYKQIALCGAVAQLTEAQVDEVVKAACCGADGVAFIDGEKLTINGKCISVVSCYRQAADLLLLCRPIYGNVARAFWSFASAVAAIGAAALGWPIFIGLYAGIVCAPFYPAAVVLGALSAFICAVTAGIKQRIERAAVPLGPHGFFRPGYGRMALTMGISAAVVALLPLAAAVSAKNSSWQAGMAMSAAVLLVSVPLLVMAVSAGQNSLRNEIASRPLIFWMMLLAAEAIACVVHSIPFAAGLIGTAAVGTHEWRVIVPFALFPLLLQLLLSVSGGNGANMPAKQNTHVRRAEKGNRLNGDGD